MPRPRLEQAVETIKAELAGWETCSNNKAAARSAKGSSAHAVRYGDGEGSRLLPRHRKLFAPFYRPHAGPTAADAAGLPAARLVDVH